MTVKWRNFTSRDVWGSLLRRSASPDLGPGQGSDHCHRCSLAGRLDSHLGTFLVDGWRIYEYNVDKFRVALFRLYVFVSLKRFLWSAISNGKVIYLDNTEKNATEMAVCNLWGKALKCISWPRRLESREVVTLNCCKYNNCFICSNNGPGPKSYFKFLWFSLFINLNNVTTSCWTISLFILTEWWISCYTHLYASPATTRLRRHCKLPISRHPLRNNIHGIYYTSSRPITHVKVEYQI